MLLRPVVRGSSDPIRKPFDRQHTARRSETNPHAHFDALRQLSGTHYRKLFSVVTLFTKQQNWQQPS